MIRRALRRCALSVAYAVALANSGMQPIAVAAAPASVPPPVSLAIDLQLGVTFTPRSQQVSDPAPILGELDLHVDAEGRVSGFLRRESDRMPEPLMGGSANGRTFFDVGSSVDGLHVDGALLRGVEIFYGTASMRDRAYDVYASPCVSAGRRLVLCQ